VAQRTVAGGADGRNRAAALARDLCGDLRRAIVKRADDLGEIVRGLDDRAGHYAR
jgi:hypothetical protein